MRVHHAEHDYGVGGFSVEHSIGESTQQRAASLAMNLRIHLGRLAQLRHCCADGPKELKTEPGALLLVAVECIDHLAPRDWTKLDTALGP